MSGVAGRSGRKHTLQSIARNAQDQLEARASNVIAAYIQKGVTGDSAVLIDLMNRIAGKVKSTTELQISGLDFNPEELYIAYRKAQQVLLDKTDIKQIEASPESLKNGIETPDVL